MSTIGQPTDFAFFLATSGHSGVDRLMANLIREIARRDYRIDLLQVREHGPYIDPLPSHVRCIDLGSRHVNGSLPGLIRYLRREKPRSLLSDKDRANRLALAARRLAGARTKITVRIGTTVSANLKDRALTERRLQYASIRHLYPLAHSIVVPSRGAGLDLAGIAGRPLPQLRVLPSPVVTLEFDRLCREPAGHPWLADRNRPLILAVGELCRRKDFATLIRAFHRLPAELDARLMILGEGRHRLKLERMIEKRGLQSCVVLPGFLPNPYPYMARADLFVLSSICEGSPVVLMEALAAGTPVVATDCPSGPREILRNGLLGPLVPVCDPTALALAMKRVLSSPPDRAMLQAAAESYHVEPAADGYIDAMGIEGSNTAHESRPGLPLELPL